MRDRGPFVVDCCFGILTLMATVYEGRDAALIPAARLGCTGIPKSAGKAYRQYSSILIRRQMDATSRPEQLLIILKHLRPFECLRCGVSYTARKPECIYCDTPEHPVCKQKPRHVAGVSRKLPY